jgi:hypothetical protein
VNFSLSAHADGSFVDDVVFIVSDNPVLRHGGGTLRRGGGMKCVEVGSEKRKEAMQSDMRSIEVRAMIGSMFVCSAVEMCWK